MRLLLMVDALENSALDHTINANWSRHWQASLKTSF